MRARTAESSARWCPVPLLRGTNCLLLINDLAVWKMADQLEQVEVALAALVNEAGGPDAVITPRGWQHMGLVIIDAVYSLQADYDTVVMPMLKRYCDAAPDLDWVTVDDPSRAEHDAKRLIEFLGPMDVERRCEIFNRQIGPGTARTGRPGRLKAEIVVDVAGVLVDHNAGTVDKFAIASVDCPQLKAEFLRIPGVGIACWKYMLNLSKVEAIKPDTMVLRWLDQTLGFTPTPSDGAVLIEAATVRLQDRGLKVTIRQIDHLVWRKASGRSLTAAER